MDPINPQSYNALAMLLTGQGPQGYGNDARLSQFFKMMGVTGTPDPVTMMKAKALLQKQGINQYGNFDVTPFPNTLGGGDTMRQIAGPSAQY